jgi:hypothetical protein
LVARAGAHQLAVDCYVAVVEFDVLPGETPIPDMRDCCPTVLEFQTSGSELLGAGPKGNVASKEIEIAGKSPAAL